MRRCSPPPRRSASGWRRWSRRFLFTFSARLPWDGEYSPSHGRRALNVNKNTPLLPLLVLLLLLFLLLHRRRRVGAELEQLRADLLRRRRAHQPDHHRQLALERRVVGTLEHLLQLGRVLLLQEQPVI